MSADDVAEAFLKNRALEKAQDYAARGRCHAQVPTEELVDAWVVTFKVWVSDHQNPLLRGLFNDVEAELVLRGIEPPYDRAKEAAEKLRAMARQVIGDLSSPDYARISAEIQREVDAFTQATKATPKN